MEATGFSALVVREEANGQFVRRVETRTLDDLPPGDVTIRVLYSSLNYKDALSASGHRGVTRRYPHTPGIDAAGVVVESTAAEIAAGDEVIVIGYDLGMNTPGGFGGMVRVPAGWVARRPAGLSLRESMGYGTAGFTAAMAVEALLDHGLRPEAGDILVTGATGGVGSFAVALLAKLGFAVAAVTGKPEQEAYLRRLGAGAVHTRGEVDDSSSRPLLKPRWAGVVDTVGGSMLASAIKSVRERGLLAVCGNVAGPDLVTTVYPFILRGITLAGIDSANLPIGERQRLWERIAAEWKVDLEPLVREVALAELDVEIERIRRGEGVGRVVVRL